MSWTRRFIWAFWIFLAIMLLWQFYTYNGKIEEAAAQPKQEHFFFYQPTVASEKAAAAIHDGPYVEQTNFTVEDNTPNNTAFTCHVTLKNTGKAKATSVSVCVRPFRGTALFDPDSAQRNDTKMLPDDSPRGMINQWVTFPDLDPGESSTQSAVFMKNGTGAYGNNPKAEIVYLPEKK
jgi:hypothetical protein